MTGTPAVPGEPGLRDVLIGDPPSGAWQRRLKTAVGWDRPRPRLPGFVALAKRYLAWSRSIKFDVEMRYAVPALYLRRRGRRLSEHPRILDAGSGPLGLAHYVGRECVGVDTSFGPLQAPYESDRLLRVKASVTALPFKDRCFELVTSMDTLEHLPASERPAAVREMFRVASRTVIVGVPYGGRSADFDRWAQALERARGDEPTWRREHVTNGLPGPELDRIVQSLGVERPPTSIRTKKHENLRFLRFRWRIGLLLPPTHPAFGIAMALLHAVAKRLHVGACYRKLYFVEFG